MKAIFVQMNNAHKTLCENIETKACEKEVLRLARPREKKTRVLGNVRCIIGEDSMVLVDGAKIKGR